MIPGPQTRVVEIRIPGIMGITAEDVERRKKLADVLARAVQYSAEAQTSRGGWGYVSAKDGNDFDEGSVSVTQVQALRAARNAGIVVPKQTIDKTH